ncbi:putative gustatory receptor 39b [Musca domestica]|uniref:Gustatory receptor n=1 Tax=Musca domestica TaxID=7370 RepID=A0A9J7D472_MUSDO|nr:putative gustatory receptor 39b [Musca domestica]
MDEDLKFVLNCCTAFGIYIPQTKYGSRRWKIGCTIYTSFLMVILSSICVLGVFMSPLENDYIISWFVSAFVFVSQIFSHLVMMWECLAKQREHTEFLRLLDEIEVAFKLKLRTDIGRDLLAQKLRRILFSLAAISILGLIIFGIHTSFMDDQGYFWWALFAILAMRMRFLQLQMYVELLNHYLWSLNRKLQQVVCLKTEEEAQLLDVDYKQLETLEYLNHIKELYSSIYEAFHCLNEFGQASMFAVTASYFLDCTCHIYWCLLALDKLFPSASIVLSISTIIPLSLNSYKFCYTCQLVKQECRLTALLVTRLNVSDSNHNCLELQKNYKSLVHDFSLQLLHQRIVVTGKRFFNFDLQCIFGICVLIVTHLIILIQFTKSDNNSGNVNQTEIQETMVN